MIETIATFVVGAALAGLAVFAGVNSATSAEVPKAKQSQSVAVYDGN
ncbi:hypothetical protein [Calidifontibacter indicus]|jgi:hypothetical protein|uniref:Uncharacterized protein n=1 Tax=Calidifontibacter indicus TaxID=419650 RepID=A0A3D9UNM4_9MICO|nr:hypothetical protein [Calidifontibacter indicus]REF31032.1 hypothetical protein DFJ65_2073 [Calidifontibacter indicus]